MNDAVTSGSQQRHSAPACSVYGAAVQQALIVLWEASDRLCGKRLRALLLQLIPVMEKHGHLSLNPSLHEQLLKVSASSIDRLFKEAHRWINSMVVNHWRCHHYDSDERELAYRYFQRVPGTIVIRQRE
ncbi:hypothetical protein HAY25_004598 [Salmonella enterica]|nr:hypothetical protein [Salmonella enterica]